MSVKKTLKVKAESRAVVRDIEAGSSERCASCKERITFRSKHRAFQVIANVYVRKIWNRVEHFHLECYEKDGSPYGEALIEKNGRRNAAILVAAQRREALALEAQPA